MQHSSRAWRLGAATMPWLVYLLAALLLPSMARAQGGAQADRGAIRVAVPFAPQPVATEGGLRLFYELLLSAPAKHAATPSQVTVRDAADGREIARFSGKALSARLSPWRPDGAALSDVQSPGDTVTVVYVELTLATQDVPRAITHEITFAPSDGHALRTVSGGQTAIALPVAAAIDPPLRGGPWAAVFHPDWPRGHRRVPYAAEGRVGIPGRFAVDWVKLDAQGRMAAGDADEVRNAYAYGEDVLAVADATVVATRNDFPESDRISTNPRHRMDAASGNFVVLDIGGGRYAFYEHLRPGSIRVTAGQPVRRGETIAQVGFSGSGNWPHLHFHIADAPSPLAAQGLPFALSRFRAVGAYGDVAALGSAPWLPRSDAASAWRENERPADNAVVWFADGLSDVGFR